MRQRRTQPCPIDSQKNPQEDTLKLYIIVRADLPPGAQLAQACHAMRLWSHEHEVTDRHWYHKSNNLVVLQVPSEACLKHLAGKAEDAGVEHSVFREPDYDNTITAIAIEPAGRKLLSNLRLALRDAA